MRHSLLQKLIFLLVSLTISVSVSAQSLLWKITGNGMSRPSYIFGTFHLHKGVFLDSIHGVKQALRTSTLVGGELDLLNFDIQGMKELMLNARLPDSLQLQSFYDSLTYKQMNDTMQVWTGTPLTMYKKFKPMYVMTMVANTGFKKKLPTIANHPSALLDLAIQQYAATKKKRVIGLETMSSQAGVIFSAMTMQRQAQLLKDVLLSKPLGGEIAMLFNLYRSANLEVLDSIMTADLLPAEKEILLSHRNIAWLPIIEKNIRQEQCFFAVGAGHIPGAYGLVNLLRKNGYTVEPVVKQ